MNGKGVFRKQNGNVYEGEYKNDKCDGFGVYRFSNGDWYEGERTRGRESRKGDEFLIMVQDTPKAVPLDFVINNRGLSVVYSY